MPKPDIWAAPCGCLIDRGRNSSGDCAIVFCPLHAAASDLLTAAKALVTDFRDTNPEELEYSAFQGLIAAITKAEGSK